MHVHDVGFPELIVVLVVPILLFWGGNFGPPLKTIQDMFRGGPPPPFPPPSHPLPGDDSRILNRAATVRKPDLHRPDDRLLLWDLSSIVIPLPNADPSAGAECAPSIPPATHRHNWLI